MRVLCVLRAMCVSVYLGCRFDDASAAAVVVFTAILSLIIIVVEITESEKMDSICLTIMNFTFHQTENVCACTRALQNIPKKIVIIMGEMLGPSRAFLFSLFLPLRFFTHKFQFSFSVG